jgi:hypothetical protein
VIVKNIIGGARDVAGSRHQEDLRIDRKTIFKKILTKYCGKVWTVVMWLTRGPAAECR